MPKILPKILLTIGDPAGIGPEIILKIFSRKSIASKFDLTVIGKKSILDFYSKKLSLPKIPSDRVVEIKSGVLFKPGKTNKSCGKLSGLAIKKAVELCLRGKFDAMVTLPISKYSLNLAGYKFDGHTEMLGKLTKCSPLMILYSDKLIVSLVTGHNSLKDTAKKISQKRIIDKVILTNNILVRDFNIKKPKIAVLSLNPHSGDGGVLGNEEIKIIAPAITKLKNAGFNIEGPFAADGYFGNKTYKKFDVTIAMYHDQGLIPFKMMAYETGVNYTGNISIVRTSPDHGTAFDIAAEGKANINSTVNAIKLAAKISENKNH
ncbi:MAG TPA: 4-hydroxythreonine-4-phosphate dehydrogenase PdxA [Ignavibacteria bacterium]|nr:4-hydroxythreonine-4-phosphate dehydrogenase PdxA [Ignavibacteria bacterium]